MGKENTHDFFTFSLSRVNTEAGLSWSDNVHSYTNTVLGSQLYKMLLTITVPGNIN